MKKNGCDSNTRFFQFFFAILFTFLIPQSVFAGWKLGKLTTKSEKTDRCPPGYSCERFEVSSCHKVTETISGDLAIGTPYGTPRGLVMFFTGGIGRAWWANPNTSEYSLAEELRFLGFQIVQVKWNAPWLISSPGNRAGIAHLACRPATVIKYVHRNYYRPLGIQPATGEGGFVITGNSGGASQVSYSLSHYKLDRIVDVAIPTGGPPHSVLYKSCMSDATEQKYWFSSDTRRFIDEGFGYFDGDGPCARQDPAYVPRWRKESTAKGGSDYYHPKTRIEFIFGKKDRDMRTVARDYYLRLKKAGSPYLTWQIVPETRHSVTETREGRKALLDAILGSIGTQKDNELSSSI